LKAKIFKKEDFISQQGKTGKPKSKIFIKIIDI